MFSSSESALAFVVGALLFASGAFLIFVVARQLLSERQAPQPESLLAPVLAVDALAPELKVLWVKSMLIDAEAPRAAVEALDSPNSSDSPAAARSPDSESARLAREMRRCLVAIQAATFAGRDEAAAGLRDDLELWLDKILAAGRAGESPDYDAAYLELSRKRTALDA